MVKFKGESFVALARLLHSLEMTYHGTMSGMEMTYESMMKALDRPLMKIDYSAAKFPPEACAAFAKVLIQYRVHLINAGLRQSLKSFDRLIQTLERSSVSMSDAADQILDIDKRIRDELEDAELWQVSSEHLKYLAADPLKLGAKFGAIYRDAEEAGKCLAYDRGTASVFHLMRIMECGLRALGVSLNDSTLDPKTNPTWEKILGRCDKEIQKPLSERAEEWKKDEAFYSTATANLRAVKDAWRNPTLHIERDYAPEDAQDVWNAVGAFMRHLAKKLDAPGSSSVSIVRD
jgi:hypothetical protein